jgi:heptaprenyl diphosphate synthase
MTRSTIELSSTPQDHHIARLAAVAIALTLIEAALPSPLPGIKPGLANIVVLLVLHQHGVRVAAWVSLLRVVAASLLLGSFLTPAFLLSLAGSSTSLLVLAATARLPRALFGAVSHSIAAAFAHIAGQFAVVYLWLIPHAGIAYLLPGFAAAALLFGTVNGLITARLLEATPRQANERLAPT